MIKINLLQRKAAVGVSEGTSAGGTGGLSGILAKLKGGGGFAAADEGMKTLIIQGGVLGIILIAGTWYLGEKRAEYIAEVDAQISEIDSKDALLVSELSKTSGYEQTKRNLEQDEKTIRTKIKTIQELILDRTTPPKILMALSEAIPKDVWLKDFKIQGKRFTISGSSNGMDVVSDFMKGLEETIYFKNVVLKSSKSETSQKAGRQTAQFELEGERRDGERK